MKETICKTCGAPLRRGDLVTSDLRSHCPACPAHAVESYPMAALPKLDPFQAVEDFRKAAAA